MSVQSALEFIRQAREDTVLKSRISLLEGGTELEMLPKIGAEAGFTFSSEELQAAYKHDYRMRWLAYSTRYPYRVSHETPEAPR